MALGRLNAISPRLAYCPLRLQNGNAVGERVKPESAAVPGVIAFIIFGRVGVP